MPKPAPGERQRDAVSSAKNHPNIRATLGRNTTLTVTKRPLLRKALEARGCRVLSSRIFSRRRDAKSPTTTERDRQGHTSQDGRILTQKKVGFHLWCWRGEQCQGQTKNEPWFGIKAGPSCLPHSLCRRRILTLTLDGAGWLSVLSGGCFAGWPGVAKLNYRKRTPCLTLF